MFAGESPTPTPYAVRCIEDFDVQKPFCNGGELIFLTEEFYDRQMDDPDRPWRCPRCGGEAEFSDDNFEKYLEDEA